MPDPAPSGDPVAAAVPMQVSAVIQMEPLWQHGQAGSKVYGGDLENFAKGMTGYLAENLDRFADPRGADLFVGVTVRRGEQTAGHQFRSGHYVKDGKDE